ncbi:MAG: PhoX family phosphatase [Acidimicrobiales bacterium]
MTRSCLADRRSGAWQTPPRSMAQQLGMGHDGMWYSLENGDGENRRGVMVLNHEYTTDDFLHEGGTDAWTAEKTLKSQNGHGLTAVEIREVEGEWVVVDSPLNRRYTGNSPMAMSGPAAGHHLLKTADPRPWGHSTTAATATPRGGPISPVRRTSTATSARHSVTPSSLTTPKRATASRQTVSATSGTPPIPASTSRHRGTRTRSTAFGWIVEVDPTHPDARPVKRTALGRFKHEGAAVTTAGDGRVVCYMGDDERFDYVYKYLSYNSWKDELSWNRSPLDHGELFVARFLDNGTGYWIPLIHGHGPLTAANGFADQAEVLVKARLAADLVGATPMDRPEWTTIGQDGNVYVTGTNNTRRTEEQVDAANPRAENAWGHIIRWKNDRDHLSVHFDWDVLVLAGPGDGVDGSTVPTEAAFGSPDGLWSDPSGRMWIETDGAQPEGANDQVLCADPATGEIKRFLSGVKGCEITGITMTPDQRTMFVNVQHPGNGDPEISSWPSGVTGDLPRPATVVITKDDGGTIGS